VRGRRPGQIPDSEEDYDGDVKLELMMENAMATSQQNPRAASRFEADEREQGAHPSAGQEEGPEWTEKDVRANARYLDGLYESNVDLLNR
jgi:hypothetical protein